MIIVFIIILLAISFFALMVKKSIDSHKNAPILGVQTNQLLLPCPDSPNCVVSETNLKESHYIEALDAKLWKPLSLYLQQQSSVDFIDQNATYMHVTFTTPIMRFVDDVEFHLRPESGIIAVRSASRQGYSDLNANRKRIEAIRESLKSVR